MKSESQHTEAVFQRQTRLYFRLAAELGNGTGFEGVKGLWKTTEVWHCERPGEAVGEGTASVAVKGPELKGIMQRS